MKSEIREAISKFLLWAFGIVFVLFYIFGEDLWYSFKYDVLTQDKTYYYTSIDDAIYDIKNWTPGYLSDANEQTGSCGVRNDDGQLSLILIKDCVSSNSISIYDTWIIELNGHSLTFTCPVAFTVYVGDCLIINGEKEGSTIQIQNESKTDSKIICTYEESELCINGGEYWCNTEISSATCFEIGGIATIENATINSSSEKDYSAGVIGKKGSLVNVSKSEIKATSNTSNVWGIFSYGISSVKDCNIIAAAHTNNAYAIYSKDYVLAENSKLVANSNITNNEQNQIETCGVGLYSVGENVQSKIINCNVYGSLAGCWIGGKTIVDGGNYDGFMYGGFTIKTNEDLYIKNATIVSSDMKDGFTSSLEKTKSTICVFDDLNLYIDNCKFVSSHFAIRIGDGADKQCNLYISNSKVGQNIIQLYDEIHYVYCGVGNDFDETKVDKPDNVIYTEETYSKSGK